jgi:predicted aldo/keto reductase-like oxidoreductase
MQYRTLGRTGQRVSAISLGTEYLLKAPHDEACAVIHAALDAGINYFDLFWALPEFRDKMGDAFRGRRHEALLVGHLGAAVENEQGSRTRDLATAERFAEDFLRRYHTDHVDVLMLHNSDEQEDYDLIMRPDHFLGVAQRWQQQGKARYIGFSGHTIKTARQATESGAIDVIMFPVNMTGHAVPGRREFYNACVAHNVALVAMKPYAGGALLLKKDAFALEYWQTGGANREMHKRQDVTPVQCLAYTLAQPGVSTIVPGCKNTDELAQALAYWDVDQAERDYASVLQEVDQYVSGECVYCNHCLPCPAHIDIGQTMRLLDTAVDGLTATLRAEYAALEANADDCIQCAACEERCPFGVAVMDKMEQAAATFAC